MKRFIFLLPLMLASCTMMEEKSSRGGQVPNVPKRWEQPVLANAPDTYSFRLWQMGGTGILNTSMGTSLTFDNQISFKDAMQTIAAVSASVYSFKTAAAAEITKRFEAGQLTIQQRDKLFFGLETVKVQADVEKFTAGLKAMLGG